jgi:protein SCO1/2
MLAMFRKFIFISSLIFILSACNSSDKQWETKNITGLMPPLEFSLTEADSGHTVHAEDFHGHVLLMFFGYMHCPDVCPTTLSRLHAAVSRLEHNTEQVRILFVSVDPGRDNLHDLAEYADAFGDEVTGLRGEQSELRELTRRYRVTYGYDKPDSNGNYNVSHSAAVYVFDRLGHARLLIRPDDSIAAISDDLSRLIGEPG